MPALRRWRILALSIVFAITSLYYLTNKRNTWNYGYTSYIPKIDDDGHVHWKPLPPRYPVTSLISLPTGSPKAIPRIQSPRPAETLKQKDERLQRRQAVKESFIHSWDGYKKNAWLRDEVAPLSGDYKDTFGGWAATLVDSLDTLWIMGLHEDFEMAVKACEEIDFTTTDSKDINVFETTIRYMGGFLAAYDISEGKYPTLLGKAVQVGELLMSVFDTPNRMPITRWDWQKYTDGADQQAPQRVIVSELGSLSLEFTRLSQLTQDPKYYDAIQRIADVFEASQNTTQLPGMWPVSVDAATPSFNEDTLFTLGGMSDSLYEYFPKQYLILGGLLEQPKNVYEKFIEVAKRHIFFRVYNPKNEALTVAGDIRTSGSENEITLIPNGQHLTCFTGGMVGLASKIFARPDDLALAEELTAGCVWAYDSHSNGIAPEIFTVMPCPKNYACEWSEDVWHEALVGKMSTTEDSKEYAERAEKHAADGYFPKGFTHVTDRRYILRPEAIESVFMMYRITGKQVWADTAWRMFQAIEKVCRTEIAAAAIYDITVPAGKKIRPDGTEKVNPTKMDSMESFWFAETLKYFYLCFEEWDVVNLDEFVLNTEAHPLRRPVK